jgi:acid stress-induced BolA-like protein IbaG/YrbA
MNELTRYTSETMSQNPFTANVITAIMRLHGKLYRSQSVQSHLGECISDAESPIITLYANEWSVAEMTV